MRSNNMKRKNAEQERRMLLQRINHSKYFGDKFRIGEQYLKELDEVEQKVKTAKFPGRQPRSFLEEETKRVSAIEEIIDLASKQGVKRSYKLTIIGFLPKIILYFLAYFTLVPKKLFDEYEAFYITFGIILFFLWLFWFSFVYKSIYIKYLIPLINNNTSSSNRVKFSAASIFIFICFQPLFWILTIIPRLINSSWLLFLNNIINLFIQTFTSNLILAIGGLITISSLTILLYKKLIRKFMFNADT